MKRRFLIALVLPLFCMGAVAFAQRGGDNPEEPKAPRGAWTPPEEDRSDYRDIVDYNIFRPDRAAIARKVEQERNPPEPDDPTPVVREPDKPTDPDAAWLLVGLSHDNVGHVAYIENTKSGEVVRLQGRSDFSKGEVTKIGYDAVVYQIEDEQRIIRIGQSFVGVDAAPSSDGSGASSSDKPKSGSSSLQERLKELRERRARELNEGKPDETDPKEAEAEAEADSDKPEEEPSEADTPEQPDAPGEPKEGGTATPTTQPTREPNR